ncbi:hypothetical protein HNY73_020208 [Argiope bruennichi]|uniref:Uncharacterized protein n=1 Tax=Argiope bruennichi TaxID=94029 RepID=A0A8T0E8L7_ARGBR|nr:hypothetical protein HNY73_020208 [Argiope bruennichi]
METSTTPETSESKRGSPGPSPSLENPSITPKEEKIPFQFENASLNDMRKAIREKWQEIEELKKAISEADEPKKTVKGSLEDFGMKDED